MFNLTTNELIERNAINTATEIYQQPDVWKETVAEFNKYNKKHREFIKSIYMNHNHVRVIFTGAGTSAFAGKTLAPELRKYSQEKVSFEAIATTDIVSNPQDYLRKDVPTILVSFARSGNSPESVAAVKLGQQLVDNFYQVIITCNSGGKLARMIKGDKKSITVLTPEKSNDKGLAMTSSFTSMLITAYLLFHFDDQITNEINHKVNPIAKQFIDVFTDKIDDILTFDFERIVYLGSGLLGELSQEAALKMLELTAGKVTAIHESSLGFRHGPKSILNDQTIVVLFMSQDPYTRKYDLDILRELFEEESNLKVVVLINKHNTEVEKLADWVFTVNYGHEEVMNDFHLSLLYILFAQAFALKKSLQLGITPDNPSPDGSINRVVKGVTIYEYKSK